MKILFVLIILFSFSISCFLTLFFLGSANLKELGVKEFNRVSISLGDQKLPTINNLEFTEIENKLGYGGDIFIMDFEVEDRFVKKKIKDERLRFYSFSGE